MADEKTTSLNPSSGPVVTEKATPELPKEAPKATPEVPKVDLGAGFAALTRKEKELLNKQKFFASKEKETKEKLERYQKYEEAKKSAKTNPIAYLEASGLSYKEITDYILNDNKPTVDGAYAELKAELLAERNERLKLQGDIKREQDEKAIAGFKYAIKSQIDSKPDDYELIRSQNAYDLVYEVAEEVFNRTQVVPDIAAVADHVEGQFEQQIEGIVKLKKLQSKLAPVAPEASPTKDAKPVASKTITNQAVSAIPSAGKPRMSIEESKKRAAGLLKWS